MTLETRLLNKGIKVLREILDLIFHLLDELLIGFLQILVDSDLQFVQICKNQGNSFRYIVFLLLTFRFLYNECG
jgi:hypothetical protein